MSDIHSLNRAAAEAFEKLERTVKTLPATTAATLSEDAREVQARLSALTQAVARGTRDRASFAELKGSLEETQAGIRGLSAAIEMHRVEGAKTDQSLPRPAEVPDRPTETRPAREISTAGSKAPLKGSCVGWKWFPCHL